MTIASVEHLPGELAGFDILALAADPDVDDREAAKVAFGLQPAVEADQPGAEPGKTACSWCGRTDPEGGLTPDYPRPAPPPPAVDIDTGKPMPVAAPSLSAWITPPTCTV